MTDDSKKGGLGERKEGGNGKGRVPNLVCGGVEVP